MVPKPNGCICQTCSEQGVECTNIAPDGQDECTECEMGVHQKDRVWDDNSPTLRRIK